MSMLPELNLLISSELRRQKAKRELAAMSAEVALRHILEVIKRDGSCTLDVSDVQALQYAADCARVVNRGEFH
jgi:hypothetical protein